MTSTTWLPVTMAVGGYLLGSIPFGIVVSKALGVADPRTAGSRNIGFTNVLRVSGKMAGFLTLAGDAGKGWIVGWAATQALESEVMVLAVALSPVLGHLHSVFLGFRGGKGVATAIGVVAGVKPILGLLMLGIWLVTAAIWRYSSGAALVACLALPLGALALGQSGMFLGFTVLLSGLIMSRHIANIRRLWAGIEPKIGEKHKLT
jgi:glycerol-3-phosphate acyltransferase PlsY